MADKCKFKVLCDEALPIDRARMLSASGGYASSWLTTIPADITRRLPAGPYRVAARLRLGLPPFDDVMTSCTCGSPNADPTIDVHHGLSCIKVRRTFVNLRHDTVKNAIHHWAKQLNCAAIVEPQHLGDSQERADNLITTPSGKMYLCDVAIVQPACPTHVNKGQERLGASKAAAAEKHRQYDAMAAARRAWMTPCIAEVYGALDEPFINFMKELTALAEYNDWCARKRFKQ